MRTGFVISSSFKTASNHPQAGRSSIRAVDDGTSLCLVVRCHRRLAACQLRSELVKYMGSVAEAGKEDYIATRAAPVEYFQAHVFVDDQEGCLCEDLSSADAAI